MRSSGEREYLRADYRRLGHYKAIWAIAHRLCNLVWLILHEGAHYEERGTAVSAESQKARTINMIKQLRSSAIRSYSNTPYD